MKIVLSSWGTTGDVYPFLALSERLLKAGHEVRVCTSDIYRERFTKVGVDFYGVGIPFQPDHFHQTIDKIMQTKNPLKSTILVATEGILVGAKQWYQDCLEGMAGYDLAICHPAAIGGQEAAIRHNLPWISVCYCPGYLKTVREAPTPLPNLGVPLNSLLWKVIEWLLSKKVNPLFNDFVVSVGGKARERFASEGVYSPELNLVAASPSICKPYPDLPKQHKFTGVWFLAEPDSEVPQALHDFLNNGPPPIVISFGSMGGTKAVETTRILIEAIKRTDQRAIIQAGWGNLGAKTADADFSQANDQFIFVGYVPHSFLFRQGCCVIHHGGAGTTAAACRAGIPSIVVPHLADQSYWGHTLRQLGVAPKHLHRQDMTPKRLAKRIHAVIWSKTMAEKAKVLAEKISAEDGLGTAVELVEQFAKEKGIQ